MPRIPDFMRHCVFYVYSSKADARRGQRSGGSGFFVGIQSPTLPQAFYVYAVTNAHVVRACKQADPILRINRKPDEAYGLAESALGGWRFHPDGDDLAAIPITASAPFKFSFMPTQWFITKDLIAQHDIGPGDDVFMVGRFVDHEGRQTNWPSVRFGNISMMNWEPVVMGDTGLRQEAFMVECRSAGGYSGSPVFVWIPPFAARPGQTTLTADQFGPWLLGVDCGHLPLSLPVVDEGGKRHPDGLVARGNAGMAVVIPAWKLQELLDLPELAAGRERQEAEHRDKAKAAVVLDAATAASLLPPHESEQA